MSKETKEVAVKESQEVATPVDMIKLAVSSGADLDKLEKLLELQQRWEANEAKKAYNVAMAKFKENPPKIDKDKTVSYQTSKGTTKYNHATLANVAEKINMELSKHGLSSSWTTKQNGQIVVTCKITHSMGHSEETSLAADADTSGSKNPIQAIGSTITYLERYTLLALTGLATSEQDDDANSIEVEYITDAELNILRDWLIKLEASEAKFVNYLDIESLEKLPMADFQKAMTAIETKKQAKGVK